MTLAKLNEAISLIDDRYLDMVDLNEKEISNMKDTHNSKPLRKRVLTALIAAVMLIFACSAAAFALKENFRAAVRSFFKIEVKDTVEQVPAENVPLTPVTAAELTEPEETTVKPGEVPAPPEAEDSPEQREAPTVSVSRVCVPNNGYAANGLFYVCADEIEYNSGSRYNVCDMTEGALVLLEQNTFDAVCRIDGKDYPIRLDWAENGSEIGIGYVDGRGCSVLSTFYSPNPSALLLLDANGSLRPVIADLTDNTAKPIAPNADYAQLGMIGKAEISENGTLLLLQTYAPSSKYYCVEVETGKIVCLNNLCGADLCGAGFASDTQFVCWTVSGGMTEDEMEELLMRQVEGETLSANLIDPGMINAWLVTPAAEEAEPILTDQAATPYTNLNLLSFGLEFNESAFSGIVCITGRYAVEKKSDGKIAVYDFIGDRQTVSGSDTFPDAEWLEPVASPDGTKLLLIERNVENGMLLRLSVLDMENNYLVSIDRDPSAVGNEHAADWFDNNTVMVDNNVYDGSGNNTGDSWYYLYQISNQF